MKRLLFLFILMTFLTPSNQSYALPKDTVKITANNLNTNFAKYGKISYLVYNKKTKESPAEGLYVVNMDVASISYIHQPAVALTQQWDGRDTVIHTAYTVLSVDDFSTRLHQTYWKGMGYSTKFDFDSKNVSFEGTVADSNKAKITEAFDASFASYNLNWHSDLFIFTLLPYKENRSFKINFYDPGFGKPTEEIYSVTGSDVLTTYSGRKISCWVMEHKGKSVGSYQKFWIDKKERIVLKEEDLFNNRYRYKLKLEISENS
jgi:hypothetical protein